MRYRSSEIGIEHGLKQVNADCTYQRHSSDFSLVLFFVLVFLCSKSLPFDDEKTNLITSHLPWKDLALVYSLQQELHCRHG